MSTSEDVGDDLEGYQLFRQAIVDRNPDAWATIADRYRRLLVAWANHCCARMPIYEPPADIADRALARAWAALAPAQFGSFPNLAALLAYLRTCVTATSIDYAREQADTMRTEQLARQTALSAPLEQSVLRKLHQAELWDLILETTMTDQEQLILRESLVYALPPRLIYACHPDQFADVADVYRIKRNLFKRLQHNPEIEHLCREGIMP
jgi:DNA-directed RNA polymerase specialized sigma24 family protein